MAYRLSVLCCQAICYLFVPINNNNDQEMTLPYKYTSLSILAISTSEIGSLHVASALQCVLSCPYKYLKAACRYHHITWLPYKYHHITWLSYKYHHITWPPYKYHHITWLPYKYHHITWLPYKYHHIYCWIYRGFRGMFAEKASSKKWSLKYAVLHPQLW